MNHHTEVLLGIRRVIKFYEISSKRTAARYGLSTMEADILAFLKNNPERDTASDIVDLRMLPKGNVSQAIDELIGKGLLSREKDSQDRRRIHLHLTPATEKILEELQKNRQEIQSQLFSGFTAEELSLFLQLNTRIFKNAALALEDEKKNAQFKKTETKNREERKNIERKKTANERK